MTDTLTTERRSWLMSRVRSRNTTPEMVVRRLLFREGYRFRLHRKDLPGSPDIVLPRLRTVVFVHGCFWHRHPECAKATMPKTRVDFWSEKFAQNVRRDEANRTQLDEMGWRSIVIWECETKSPTTLLQRLVRELEQYEFDEAG